MQLTNMKAIFAAVILLRYSFISASPIHHAAAELEASPIAYAALGDSYAAGNGAGHPKISGCGRFTDAYPIQIAHNDTLNIDCHRFRNLACGGTTSLSVLHQQVPHIGHSDIVTITVGGNEVRFFGILNACIYHWLPAQNCEQAIINARTSIQSSVLLDNIETLISGTMAQLAPQKGLLLVTGYARFFNDATDICDHRTFSRTHPIDYLTKAKRTALNELVTLLNQVIKAAAETHGAVYVDIDRLFEGHRFCEQDVQEPDLQRSETWFFNLPSMDFEADVIRTPNQDSISIAADVELEWGLYAENLTSFPDLESIRTFHPTGLGHTAIALEIVREVLARRT